MKGVRWIGSPVLLLMVAAIVFSCALAARSASLASVNVQVCLVIDGSGSINSSEWTLIKQAIAEGINNTIPHDGSVELSIVEFGGTADNSATTEIRPTIINASDFESIANQVLNISKRGGGTPTAHGVYLGWHEIMNSPNFAAAKRHVINLATDETPSVRNQNATNDLDGSGGSPNARDDLIAVVNNAVGQGLDELDVEGIGLPDDDRDWFKNWTVRPQPGIVVPPFSKPGWIRIVADVPEFARTLSEKLQVIIPEDSGNSDDTESSVKPDVWVPSAGGALAASIFSVGITSVVSSLGSAVSDPGNFPSQEAARKLNEFLPETVKKWLHEFISSKRKLILSERRGQPLMLTKLEVFSYIVSFSVLTLAFSYVKATSLDKILLFVPTVLATSIVVEFAKNYSIEVVARSRGVWTEHRLWYFGLTTFMLSTLLFKVPFSSPSRITHHSPKFTKRSLGLVASASVFIALALAGIFYSIFLSGFVLIGNIGIMMCLTMAFFDSIPIPPMNGKDIYDWNKALSTVVFTVTSALYAVCLLLLQA